MLRLVRMLMVAISIVLVLLTMQIGVEAKKKTKRKHRTTRSAPVIVVPFTLSPAISDDSFINTAAPTHVAPSSQVGQGGVSIESISDSDGGTSGKRLRGRLTIGPPGPHAAAAGTLLISEFRLRGPNGANDEFIEIYNNSGANHTVTASSGTGYGIAASDSVLRCTIPNATVIPAFGHFLCTNSVGYSYSAYPAGNGT